MHINNINKSIEMKNGNTEEAQTSREKLINHIVKNINSGGLIKKISKGVKSAGYFILNKKVKEISTQLIGEDLFGGGVEEEILKDASGEKARNFIHDIIHQLSASHCNTPAKLLSDYIQGGKGGDALSKIYLLAKITTLIEYNGHVKLENMYKNLLQTLNLTHQDNPLTKFYDLIYENLTIMSLNENATKQLNLLKQEVSTFKNNSEKVKGLLDDKYCVYPTDTENIKNKMLEFKMDDEINFQKDKARIESYIESLDKLLKGENLSDNDKILIIFHKCEIIAINEYLIKYSNGVSNIHVNSTITVQQKHRIYLYKAFFDKALKQIQYFEIKLSKSNDAAAFNKYSMMIANLNAIVKKEVSFGTKVQLQIDYVGYMNKIKLLINKLEKNNGNFDNEYNGLIEEFNNFCQINKIQVS
jgi:hypothetical protein